jgi:hypothetical protein
MLPSSNKLEEYINKYNPSYSGSLESLYEWFYLSGYIYGLPLGYYNSQEASNLKTFDGKRNLQNIENFVLLGLSLNLGYEDIVSKYKSFTSEYYKEDLFHKLKFKNFKNILSNISDWQPIFDFADLWAFRNYILAETSQEFFSTQYSSLIYLKSVLEKVVEVNEEKNKVEKMLVKAISKMIDDLDYKRPEIEPIKLDKIWFSYCLDLTAFAMYADHELTKYESEIYKSLSKETELSIVELEEKLIKTEMFILNNEDKLPHLINKSSTVLILNSRKAKLWNILKVNQERIKVELDQSVDLVRLLKESQHRDLTKEEKKDVKSQLTDIFKTIPSLTIFMIPGGSLLLPIIIKMMPKLLPSSFRNDV